MQSYACEAVVKLSRDTVFLGALAKRGASNSLILPEEEGDQQQGKTSAFFAIVC